MHTVVTGSLHDLLDDLRLLQAPKREQQRRSYIRYNAFRRADFSKFPRRP